MVREGNMKIYKIFIFLASCLILELSAKHKNYGAFNVVVTKVDICKGPKHMDCAVFRANVTDSVNINFDILFTESMSPTRGKVLVISEGKEFLRLQVNKPCENVFMKSILRNLFNATNNCVIKKGRYVFALDFQESLRGYYGGMHLYGIYSFKSIFYGDHCNFSCSVIEVKISPNE